MQQRRKEIIEDLQVKVGATQTCGQTCPWIVYKPLSRLLKSHVYLLHTTKVARGTSQFTCLACLSSCLPACSCIVLGGCCCCCSAHVQRSADMHSPYHTYTCCLTCPCLWLQLQHEQSHYRQLMSHLATVEKEKEALGAQVGCCLRTELDVAAPRASLSPVGDAQHLTVCCLCHLRVKSLQTPLLTALLTALIPSQVEAAQSQWARHVADNRRLVAEVQQLREQYERRHGHTPQLPLSSITTAAASSPLTTELLMPSTLAQTCAAAPSVSVDPRRPRELTVRIEPSRAPVVASQAAPPAEAPAGQGMGPSKAASAASDFPSVLLNR